VHKRTNDNRVRSPRTRATAGRAIPGNTETQTSNTEHYSRRDRHGSGPHQNERSTSPNPENENHTWKRHPRYHRTTNQQHETLLAQLPLKNKPATRNTTRAATAKVRAHNRTNVIRGRTPRTRATLGRVTPGTTEEQTTNTEHYSRSYRQPINQRIPQK